MQFIYLLHEFASTMLVTLFFFLMVPRPQGSTLFPYTTLFRSDRSCLFDVIDVDHDTGRVDASIDRKSTRLNSSHLVISYAVFCLKKIIYMRIMMLLKNRS